MGINLLREGLDIPEVSLVAILDADKEGFLRSETSLLQTCGRAARNERGRVIMYADRMTASIEKTVQITLQRRKIQNDYNVAHGIIPKSVKREMKPLFEEIQVEKKRPVEEHLSLEMVRKKIKQCESEMRKSAKELQFEEAAKWRDLLHHYQEIERTYS